MLLKDDRDCISLVMEAMKYHLLPERRLSLQNTRTKPRKSTVGVLYAVGGMDSSKGKFMYLQVLINLIKKLIIFV